MQSRLGIIAWSLIYVGVAVLGRATRPPDSAVALVWPAAGIAVLWVLSQRHLRARAVALATLAVLGYSVNGMTGASVAAAAGLATANVVNAVVVVAVLERGMTSPRGVQLTGTADLFRILVAAAAGAVASAPFGLIAWAVVDEAPLVAALGAWVLRYGVMTALISSAWLSLQSRDAHQNLGTGVLRRGEIAAMVLVSVGAYVAVFADSPGQPIAFLILPLSVWIGVRAGPTLTAVHGLWAGAVAVAATLRDIGPFGSIVDPLNQSAVVQAFIAVVGLVGLALSLAVEDRWRAVDDAGRTRSELQQTLDGAMIGHAVISLRAATLGNIRYANQALQSWAGTDAPLVGRSWLDLVDPSERAATRALLGVLAHGGKQWRGEVRHLADGVPRWSEVSIASLAPAEGDGEGCDRATLQLLDVTERREFSEQLQHQALHDDLTGLPNRALLRDRLEHAIATMHRDSRNVVVIFLDLDHFKTVNDSLGHAAGDAVINATAQRLVGAVRPGDTVARIGGDEFVVVCPDVGGRVEATMITERLLELTSGPVIVDGEPISVGLSAGVAIAAGDVDAGDLLREADTAMYYAKARGRGRIEFFEESFFLIAQRRQTLTEQIRSALEHDEFVLHYQPIVNLDTGEIIAVEALVRWNHPERGLLYPVDWLDVAEGSGMMVELGTWVLCQACSDVAALPSGTALQAHVNVSASQLRDDGIMATVIDVLADTGLDPARLVLELTETQLVDVRDGLLAELNLLRDSGVVLAVDDFGTHYSSLSHLTTMPVGEIKIDRSFIAVMQIDERARAVVHGVLGMARALGVPVVAEGIETSAIAAELQQAGCQMGQGYLWSRPQPWENLMPELELALE
jgi:diguanylate cyclase (GGDEF)-like protein